MKFVVSIILILCFFSAKAQHIDSIITIESLQQTVWYLSSDSLHGRLTGSKGAEDAAIYIRGAFKENGIRPLQNINNYFDSFGVYINKIRAVGINVVGAIPSNCNNDSIVVISAHYDHIGQGNDLFFNNNHNKYDSIYNGANDNASGTAALLEIAKYYARLKLNKYTLLFVAFSGEELGEIGSQYFANNIKCSVIKAVINFDMLGRPNTSTNSKCTVVSDNNYATVRQLNKSLQKQSTENKIKFFIKDNHPEDRLYFRSDHYSFDGKVKNIFTLMTTSTWDQYYHSVKDEYETIDFDFLLSTTKKIAMACRIFIE